MNCSLDEKNKLNNDLDDLIKSNQFDLLATINAFSVSMKNHLLNLCLNDYPFSSHVKKNPLLYTEILLQVGCNEYEDYKKIKEKNDLDFEDAELKLLSAEKKLNQVITLLKPLKREEVKQNLSEAYRYLGLVSFELMRETMTVCEKKIDAVFKNIEKAQKIWPRMQELISITDV